ncbi:MULTISPECIES: hypothetical protein [Streptomyces]|uniref:hypothetical protein n=1 Tax=Streptomyces TaxID=1883 RepID=UPI003657C064
MTEERTLEGSLHDLSVVTGFLTRVFDSYFDGETDTEEWRTWDAKCKSVRRVLCERINSTLDVYEGRADGRGMSARGEMLLGMVEVDLKKFDIHRTPDGKLFTYEGIERKGTSGDREENGEDAS